MDPTQGANVQGLARLVSSSKGLIFIGAVVAGLVLVFTGHLGAELVYGKIVTLAMVFFSAVAVEDGSRHLADRPRAAPVTVNMQTVPPPPAPPPEETP